jgi:putative ABC transport system permease protein
MVPLETLSKMAGNFLIVILLIGAIILVVLNIFNIRERKYEIGVLTAMGMKKGKVALQFLIEIFVVTLIAVIIGASVGAVTSVPVTNALLENQVSSQSTQAEQVEQNFGRGGDDMGGNEKPDEQPDAQNQDDNGGDSKFAKMFDSGSMNNYITEVNSAMNFTVLLQMIGICILLTLISGAVSMMFVMRYEPLKILANRD